MEKYRSPYSITDLLKLHEVMTRYTVDEFGAFRKGEEGIFIREEAPLRHGIRRALYSLCDNAEAAPKPKKPSADTT